MAFVNLRQQKMEAAKKWLSRVRVNQLWPRQGILLFPYG